MVELVSFDGDWPMVYGDEVHAAADGGDGLGGALGGAAGAAKQVCDEVGSGGHGCVSWGDAVTED